LARGGFQKGAIQEKAREKTPLKAFGEREAVKKTHTFA
jgi:hypothetical protein